MHGQAATHRATGRKAHACTLHVTDGWPMAYRWYDTRCTYARRRHCETPSVAAVPMAFTTHLVTGTPGEPGAREHKRSYNAQDDAAHPTQHHKVAVSLFHSSWGDNQVCDGKQLAAILIAKVRPCKRSTARGTTRAFLDMLQAAKRKSACARNLFVQQGNSSPHNCTYEITG